MKIDSETHEHSLKRKNRKGRGFKQEQKENMKEENKNIKQENKRYSKQEDENVMNQSKALKTDCKQIHKIRKQYVCQYCEKEFKQSSHLKAHEMIHTGEPSHYKEVPRWDIFMEEELRFGLDLG